MSEQKEVDVQEQSTLHELPLLTALDFSSLIEEKQRAHCTGTREWLFDGIREWLQSSIKRLFWVVGDAGTGKSVISAKLLQLDGIQEHIVAWHFCRHDNAAMSEVNVILMSWAAMLSEKLPGFQAPKQNSSSLAGASAEEVFEQLIRGPLSRMTPPSAPCVIVLDALDELPKEALSPVLSVIANEFDSLPTFMRLFVTSRNQHDIVKRLEKFGSEKLLVDEVRNKADLRAYLAHIAREHVDLEITTAALERILEREFSLSEATLDGKLVELESLIAQSKYIYQEAVSEFKTLPDYRAIRKIQDIECYPPPMQSATSMEALYADAHLAHAKLMAAFAKGREEGWVDLIVDPGLKTLESATRKVHSDYKGNFRLLKDLTRFTAEFLSCSRMNDFLQNLRASKDFEYVALRNKHANPTALGYRDFNITLLVKLETGQSHLCELQVNLKSMLSAKEKAHLHYEKIRVHIPHICAVAHITDMRRFETALTRILNNSVLDAAVAELELKAGGLFLYATLLANQLQQDKHVHHSKLDFAKLYALPSGLSEIYLENFDRLVGADKARWKEFVSVISLIVATREPLPQKLAEAVLGPRLEDLQSSLSVLFPVREGCFQVMHKSVVDWLRDDQSARMYHISTDDVKVVHAALGRYLLECWVGNTPSTLHSFAIRQVVYHLCEANITEELYAVMSDLNWVLTRGKSAPAELLRDCEFAVKSGGPHQSFYKLLHSALKACLQEWSEDYQRLPGQLLGRLMGHEKDVDFGKFLEQVRNWSGPPQGWWAPLSQTLPPAGGLQLSVFKLSGYSQCVQWSSDETSVVWTENSAILNVTNMISGELLTFEGHTDVVQSASWSSDGKRVCSGGRDKTVRVWDVKGEECVKVLEGHTDTIYSVSWSRDSKRVCSGGRDKTVRVWDVESGECVKVLEGHYDPVDSVSWSNDGKRVCSGSSDKTVRVWDVESGECVKVLKGHTFQVNTVSCSDNKRVCSGSRDKTVRVWDVESGKCTNMLRGHSSFVQSVSWSSDGKRVCSASSDQTVRVWDIESGECVKVLKGHTDVVHSVSWSSDSKRVCSGGRDKTVCVWDVDSHLQMFEGHTYDVTSVSWSSDGKRVCSCSSDQTVRVWDIASGECVKVLRGHVGPVESASWSSDNKRVCSASSDRTVRVWDVESGECVKVLREPNNVHSVSWSSDGKRVCSGGRDKTVRVWDIESGECVKVLEGHTDVVESVSWSSDSKRVCSGGRDKTVRVWDVESGECVKVLEGHTYDVTSVSWSSDSKRVCSGSSDKTVRVWDIESGFSFCTLLLDLRLRPVVTGPVKFVGEMHVTKCPLLGSRAVGIEGQTLHIMRAMGQKGTVVSDEELQKCNHQESTCLDCQHRAWCLVNLVQLPLGVQEEERTARQALV